MKALLLSALALAACGSSAPVQGADAGPPTDAGETADGPMLHYHVTAKVEDFAAQADPAGPVEVSLYPAWQDDADPFPTASPIAQVSASAAGGFVAAFDDAVGTFTLVAAMVVRGEGVATSINDRHWETCQQLDGDFSCTIGSAAQPYPIWTIGSDVYDAWKAHSGLRDLDWTTYGLAVVTYRSAGTPVAGVTPVGSASLSSGTLRPLSGVYFLSADRRTIEDRTTTGPSGTVLIPLASPLRISGLGGLAAGAAFEILNIASNPDTVYFEQVDPR